MALLKNKKQTLTPAEIRQKEIEAEEKKQEALAKMSEDDVPLNFQKLEIIEARLAVLGKQYNKLTPLVQEEIRTTGGFNGKYCRLQQKIDGELRALRKKQEEIKTTIHKANEPATDPVRAVLDKYRLAEVHNRQIKLLASVIKEIEDLMISIQKIDDLAIPQPFVLKRNRQPDLASLQSLRFNYEQELKYLRPMTEETKKAEMAAAVATVAKMMAKVQEEKTLDSEFNVM